VKSYDPNLQKKFWKYFALNWILALQLALIPQALKAFGVDVSYSEGIAWCSARPYPVTIMIVYVPVFIEGVFISVTLSKIVKILKERNLGQNTSLHILLWLPLIVVLSWFPGFVNRFVSWITGEEYMLLYIMHVIFSRLMGFFNVVVYGRSKAP